MTRIWTEGRAEIVSDPGFRLDAEVRVDLGVTADGDTVLRIEEAPRG